MAKRTASAAFAFPHLIGDEWDGVRLPRNDIAGQPLLF